MGHTTPGHRHLEPEVRVLAELDIVETAVERGELPAADFPTYRHLPHAVEGFFTNGGKRLFVLGVGWLVIFSILGGIARTELMLVFARALQGLGPAAFLPSSVMLLGSVYRPGPRKNLVSYYYFYFCLILRQPQLESRSPSAPQTLRAG